MPNSARILILKCPSCGSGLEISPDMDTFACGYCGTQQMVQRRGGTVSLKLIGDAIARVQVGTDRTAAELAVRRLREDIAAIEAEKYRLKNQEEKDPAKLVLRGCGGFSGCLSAVLFLPIMFAGTAAQSKAAASENPWPYFFLAFIICLVVSSAINNSKHKEAQQSLSDRAATMQAELDKTLAFLRTPR